MPGGVRRANSSQPMCFLYEIHPMRWLRSWLRSLGLIRSLRPTAVRRTASRPQLEGLEERLAPAGDLLSAHVLQNSTGNAVQNQAVTSDQAGDSFVTGEFSGTVTIGSTTLTAQGTNDAFVAKYSPAGILVWAVDIGGAGALVQGNAIAVDSSGDVLTTGSLFGTANFNPAPGSTNGTLTNVGNDNAYVLKLDASGNFVWADLLGSGPIATAIGNGIAVDTQGNVYSTGFFEDTGNFDPAGSAAGILSSSNGGNDDNAYVSKLNSAGSFVWADDLGAGSSTFGEAIAVDSTGNVYTTGFFIGSGSFNPTGTGGMLISSTDGTDTNSYVSKLDTNGNFIWADELGNAPAASSARSC